MKDMIKKLRNSMEANVIGIVVAAILLYGAIITVVFCRSFSVSFTEEFSKTAYHMANTASVLVNGDHIDKYLAGEEMEEYRNSKRYLDTFCRRMNVSMIYVIRVDTSDYGSFRSVFDCINNSAGDTDYKEWELGHYRETGGEGYRQIYQDLYETGMPYGTFFNMNPVDNIKPYITTLVPVLDSTGATAAILCLQRPASQFYEFLMPYMASVALMTFFLALLCGCFLFDFLRRQVLRPIRKVSREATRFARENTSGDPITGISRYYEISELARSIETMEADMVSYMQHLTEATAEKERMRAELSLASTIQENALPNRFPAFPDRKDFDIHASMTPAKEVGGDFYNFFLIDPDHLLLMIGDVSDKGVPAALFMMQNNIILCDRAQMGGTPREILEFVNGRLCEQEQLDMFVTLWVGILELSTGSLVFANAGHEDAAIYRKNGSFQIYKTKHSMVCGAIPGIRYRDFELKMEPGDKLFIYTDGVPEASDRNDNMFTAGRMLDALNEYRDGTPREILEGVRRNVQSFVGDALQFDDLTMLCVEYRGMEG